MLYQFDRKYRLTLGATSGSSLGTTTITDSHIEFDIKKTSDSKQNTLELKIFNLSKDTISKFDVKDVLVTLEVAYGDSPYSVIFRGDKASMKTENKPPEIITTVIAAEGYVASREGRVQSTVGEGSSLKDVLTKLVKEGYPEIEVINISNDIPSKTYKKGYSATGSARVALENICKANNLLWNIDKNIKINIYPKVGEIGTQAIIITPQNGLIASPEKTSQEIRNLKDDLDVPPDTGIRFETLLNPRLEAGALVAIRGTFDSDGDYRMETISHRGSYESNEWTTTVEAVSLK